MKKELFLKLLPYIFLVSVVYAVIEGVSFLKNSKIDNYKKNVYSQQVQNSHKRLKELIQEKQNDTMTLSLSFAQLDSIKKALKQQKSPQEAVEAFAQEVTTHTKFKNPWFQLIDKEGRSVYRSWDKHTGDNIKAFRNDIQYIFANKKPFNSLSVGRYDMTFKSAVPIFDRGEFLGVFEVITHFNSIARELKKMQIDALFLADKKYKQNFKSPMSSIFLQDYYVALLEPNKEILNYLSHQKIDLFLNRLQYTDYMIVPSLDALASYYPLKDNDENIIGHTVVFSQLNKLDTTTIEDIKMTYSVYSAVALSLVFGLFYLFGFYESKQFLDIKNNRYIFVVLFAIMLLNLIHYQILNNRYKKDMTTYNNATLKQIENEFLMVYEKNKKLSRFIFTDDIDTKDVKNLFGSQKREELHAFLQPKYEVMKEMYSIRQLHFHTTDNRSFLRMHKPLKYGDSLQQARQSVVWVNKHLKPFDGFEEGKIFNGFRYLFPLFDEDKKHLGSVEISFDAYSFIESYLESFDRKRINFLIKEDIIGQKVMQSEQQNYIKSPVKGFLFDAQIIKRLDLLGKTIQANKKSDSKLQDIAYKINQGRPYWEHFEKVNEIVYGIPLKNKITNEVVASVQISQSDYFIQQLKKELWLYFFIGFAVSLLVALIVYKEFKAKQNMMFLKQQAVKEKEKAQQVAKYKSEFLANMSHEIRTPLNAIMGFVELLREKIKEDENRKYLETIYSSSHHLLGVINDILDFSKLESGKLQVEAVEFDVKKEFSTIYQLFSAQVSEKDIQFVMDVDKSLPPVLITDPLRIKQVISNLLSNAIKFTKEHKKISLQIKYKRGKLFVSVKDEGIGIKKEKLKQIFEAFSQADSSTTREYGGTGLGLSISSELVRLLGGRLRVKSKQGLGSEFYFAIPVKEGSLKKQNEHVATHVSFKGKKVLLVEDNKANQMFMQVVLKKLELDFEIANDGLEAVEIFGQKSFDIVLMDENMPNMSGIEATKEILQIEKERESKHTPIIALTANAFKGDREKFLGAGMDEYLTKPVDRNKLKEVLSRFIGDSDA